MEILDSAPWWLFVRVVAGESTLIVGTVYFKPDLDFRAILELFQAVLDEIVAGAMNEAIVIGGDFNARVGNPDPLPKEIFDETILESNIVNSDTTVNPRGRPLIDLMEGNGFVLINGRSPSDRPAQMTFCSSAGSSVIDLVFVNVTGLNIISDFYIGAEAGLSDHFPAVLEVSILKLTTNDRPEELTEQPCESKQLFWVPGQIQQYMNAMRNSEHLTNRPCIQNRNAEALYEGLVSAISSAAEEAGMSRVVTGWLQSKSGKSKDKPWFDRPCKDAKRVLRLALKAAKKDCDNLVKRNEYLETKKRYRALIRLKKKEYGLLVAGKFAMVRLPAEFWRAVKAFRSSSSSFCTLPMHVWNDFYSRIYPARLTGEDGLVGEYNPLLDGDFTLIEVTKAIRESKCGKAPGLDQIKNEFIINAPIEWHVYILELFNKILREEKVPRAWGETALTMLYKKGDRNDPANYRGIALVNNITKLFTTTLKNRIEKFAEDRKLLPESQLGFRKGKGCTECIFTLTSAIQLQLRLGEREVYVVFVDFKRAFDSIPHDKLWAKLYNLGISVKIIRIIKSLYDHAKVRVKCRGLLSEEFEVSEGVLQGESLSPLLFLLYLADIEKKFRDSGLCGVNIDGSNDLLMLMYADDTVVLAHSHVDLQRKLAALRDYCDENGLTVNTAKTKIMVCKAGGRPRAMDRRFTRFGQDSLEVVNSYDYLGVPITSSSLGLAAAETALRKAKVAAGTALSILARAKSDSWEAYTRLFDSLVSSTLLFAFPSWGMRYLEVVERAQTDFFKRLLYLPRNTPNWAVRLETGNVHLAHRAMRLTYKWYIKVLKMDDSSLPKLCLLRLMNLAENQVSDDRYNWAVQFRLFLQKIDCLDLWGNLDPGQWEVRLEVAFKNYESSLRISDIVHALLSDARQFQLYPTVEVAPAKYLTFRLPIALKRIMAQLRLANKYYSHLSYKKCLGKFNPGSICQNCNLGELETVEHFLCRCPIYQPLRSIYIDKYLSQDMQHGALERLLEDGEVGVLMAIYNFAGRSLLLRAFSLNE